MISRHSQCHAHLLDACPRQRRPWVATKRPQGDGEVSEALPLVGKDLCHVGDGGAVWQAIPPVGPAQRQRAT
jgi:hypothetical protein